MHFETRTKVNPRSDATRERTERFCFRSSLGSGRLIAIDGRINRRTMRLAVLKLDWKLPSLTCYNDNRSRSMRVPAASKHAFVMLILTRIEQY